MEIYVYERHHPYRAGMGGSYKTPDSLVNILWHACDEPKPDARPALIGQ